MISVFHTSLTNPDLPTKLAGAADSGVVIGADFARVHHLAFILNARTSEKHGWEGFSFAELATHNRENFIGSEDYQSLLSLRREIAVSDIMRMLACTADLPKADELLRRRRAMPVAELNPTDPATAVINSADSFLQKTGCHFVDDQIQRLAELPPNRLPIRASMTLISTHVVLLVSHGITQFEAAIIAKYLANPDPFWISEISVVVEDVSAWNLVKERVEVPMLFEDEIVERAAAERAPVYYGHLQWNKATLLDHAEYLQMLAKSVLRQGGKTSDITFVTRNKAGACLLRTRLIELGVPLQCSESHMLFMRPGIWSLLSLVSMAHGYGHAPGLVRVTGKSRDVAVGELDEFLRLLEAPGQPVRIFSAQMRAVFESLQPLRARLGEVPGAVLQTAFATMRSWASAKDHSDAAEYAPALFAWAAQFKSVTALLKAFWRLRALVSGWSGYRPQSGINVTHELPRDPAKWTVLLLPEEQMPTAGLERYTDCTLIKAPVEVAVG